MTWRPKGFRLGAMRERIKIETPTETLDANGQPVVTWTAVATQEPAKVELTSGGETIRGRQLEAGVSAVITVHFRDIYDTTQRVTHNGKIYNPVAVLPVDGGRRYIELMCRGLANG